MRQLSLPAILALLVLFLPASAKTLRHAQGAARQFGASRYFANGINAAAIGNFESALSPYLRSRAAHSALPASTYIPTEADYMALAKVWSGLSQDFKNLYEQATQITAGLKTYDSPGGHFQIIYSTSGQDAINTTDTIGYSSSDWRVQTSGGNGVPDYVEYVAYAADSAWSMEVERFGFHAPDPYIDNYYTDASRAKIWIQDLGPGYYGFTVPDEPDGSMGWRTYTEIQNNWNSFAGAEFQYGIYPEYDTHPQKAIQVTCMHEISLETQYAMTRSLNEGYIPADLTITWSEGTATLMEDLGFNYAHDYLQYLPDYFDNPQATVLANTDNNDQTLYKSCVVTIYLYHYVADTPCICFIKNMFLNDYDQPIGFMQNLEKSAPQSGRTWPDLLGSFHVASYYTGSRAVAGRFIPDAPLITQGWTYPHDSLSASGSVTKSVNFFAMNTFDYLRQPSDNPTLAIRFLGDTTKPGDTDTNAVWSVHCILKMDSIPAHDTILSVPFSSKGSGGLDIAGWHNYTEALVIATNARYDTARSATVSFQGCGVTVDKGQTVTYASAAAEPRAMVTVHAAADLSCSLYVAKTTITSTDSQAAINDSLILAGSFYDVEFPLGWLNGAATMQLSLTESRAATGAIAAAHHLTDSSFDICRWNAPSGNWIVCESVPEAGDLAYVNWQCALASAGVYGLFARAYVPDSTVPVVAFPNPARLGSHKPMEFRGPNILELWVYLIDGTCICYDVKGQNSDPRSLTESPYGFDWQLCNNAGRAVSPGVYFAKVGYKDPVTKGTKVVMRKLFVIP